MKNCDAYMPFDSSNPKKIEDIIKSKKESVTSKNL